MCATTSASRLLNLKVFFRLCYVMKHSNVVYGGRPHENVWHRAAVHLAHRISNAAVCAGCRGVVAPGQWPSVLIYALLILPAPLSSCRKWAQLLSCLLPTRILDPGTSRNLQIMGAAVLYLFLICACPTCAFKVSNRRLEDTPIAWCC